MKISKKVINIFTAVTLGFVVTAAAFALPIPGLQKTPPGAPYTESAVTNHNVEALLAYPPQALEKTIAPYLPAGQSMAAIAKGVTPLLPAGIGRKQVVVVEPVLTDGTPDVAKSGAALLTAIQTANAKPYAVVVYADAGHYDIGGDSITLNKNVTLKGMGRMATVIKAHEVRSSSTAISGLTLTTSLLRQTGDGWLHDLNVDGSVWLESGTVVVANISIATTIPEQAGLTIGNVTHFSLRHLAVTSTGPALIVNSSTQGSVFNSVLAAVTPISMTANAKVLFANNLYSGGTPHFYGDYKTSQQRCHNNIDATGLPVPNYASGVSPLCVAPTTG